jgi:hypothetical protein
MTPDLEEQVPKSLGSLTLTEREVRGLDRLMELYRRHPQGSCSTADHIVVKYPRYFAGHARPMIITERFDDLSCDSYRLPGLTNFPSLAQRLERRRE